MAIPEVDREKCTGCGDCADVCPPQGITIEDDVAVIDPRFCEECGVCIDECEEGALSLPREKGGQA